MSDIITKLQRVVWAEKWCRSDEVVLEPFGAHISRLFIDGLLVVYFANLYVELTSNTSLGGFSYFFLS